MIGTLFAVFIGVVLGIGFCFFGYRLFLVMLPIWGFFAGLWLGGIGVSSFLGGGFLATITGWVVGIGLGLICALFSYLFYLVGVALVSAVIGIALGSGIMSAVGFQQGLLVMLVGLAAGVVVATLTLRHNWQKYVVITLTALAGANLIVLAGLLLFGVVTLSDMAGGSNLLSPVIRESWLAVAAWLALAIAGIVAQIRTSLEFEFTQERYVEGWG
jgi:hypothetical protein